MKKNSKKIFMLKNIFWTSRLWDGIKKNPCNQNFFHQHFWKQHGRFNKMVIKKYQNSKHYKL